MLDSVILIDHFNGRKEATDYLKRMIGLAAVSVITRAELLVGVRDAKQREKVVAFLDAFPVIEITKEIGDLAAEMRRERGWKLPDALQAAAAISSGMKLATRNTKDFGSALEFVEIPYK